VVKPFRENGAWVTATSLEIDLTKTINSFTVKSEKALAQGRSQPKLLLGLIANGTASTTSYVSRQLIYAWHTRKRKLTV
jgi:hypothetical protein